VLPAVRPVAPVPIEQTRNDLINHIITLYECTYKCKTAVLVFHSEKEGSGRRSGEAAS
jgi:hypothetical protein